MTLQAPTKKKKKEETLPHSPHSQKTNMVKITFWLKSRINLGRNVAGEVEKKGPSVAAAASVMWISRWGKGEAT